MYAAKVLARGAMLAASGLLLLAGPASARAKRTRNAQVVPH
jgi:hypothetical protein